MFFQEKRVVVTIVYSEEARPFFLTAAQMIKVAHPDVLVEKREIPHPELAATTASFEIQVDGKVLGMGGRSNSNNSGGAGRSSSDNRHAGDGKAVFVSMEELGLAISKARKKKRPNTLYGDGGGDNPNKRRAARLDMLKRNMNKQ